MGTALTGSTVASTYDALLKVTDNGPLGGTAKVITDGMGNDSVLKLGTAGAEFTGPLTVDGQIVFPATQNASADANTLDDYEEGNWTPSVGGNSTYTVQTGRYTKIGRMVIVSGRIVINVLGTGSTSVISGLPFTVENASDQVFPVSVGFWNNLAVSPVFVSGYAAINSTTIQITGITAAGASTGNLAVFGDSADLMFSVAYNV